MTLTKLELIEKALAGFKGRYDDLEASRDVLLVELEDLKSINLALLQEKKEIKKKVDLLLERLNGLAI